MLTIIGYCLAYMIPGLIALQFALRDEFRRDYLQTLSSDLRWAIYIMAIVLWPTVVFVLVRDRLKRTSPPTDI